MIGKLPFRRKRVIDLPAAVPEGELPVLNPDMLIERTETKSLVDALRTKLGFPPEVFDGTVRPVIAGFAEFVQLLPASESDHYAQPGGLFTHAVEVVSLALDLRRGQILPRGAPPEAIGEQAHRWTYAVFVAALLHDVGRTIAKVRVLIRTGRCVPGHWSPLSGAMSICGAVSYRVEFLESAATQTELQGRLPVQLLNRLVPPSVLEWLAAAPELMRELLGFLAGENSARTGAISSLVLRATAESRSRDPLPRGKGDPRVQQPAPAANSAGINVEGGFDRPSENLNTTVAAQPGAATTITNESATPEEETEYLEDVDESERVPAQTSHTADAGLAQAPDAARRFIGWLQQGLAEGSLRVNQAGALVHFVDEGMLLVSPRIFKKFATRFGEDGGGAPASAPGDPDIGKYIQRQVLRAGWHLRADKGVNILTYQVMRGDHAASRLSGVVIRNPARFVNPVPPSNPLLVRLREEHGDT